MDSFFSSKCIWGPFLLFSPPHLWAIAAIASANIIMYLSRSSLREEKRNRYFRCGLAFILISQEVSFQMWNLRIGEWSLDYSLPLQLCGISAILSSLMLITGSYGLYEVLYFWGIGGALQAIFTPEIGPYTFPHFRYFQFFLGHGAIITACIFMAFIEGYRVNLKSLRKSFILLNIYAIFIGFLNKTIEANYMFLCQKPRVSSIMDFLGPWPWYILSLEFAAFLIFFILLKISEFTRDHT